MIYLQGVINHPMFLTCLSALREVVKVLCTPRLLITISVVATLEKLQLNFQKIIEEDRGFVIRSPFAEDEINPKKLITEEQL